MQACCWVCPNPRWVFLLSMVMNSCMVSRYHHFWTPHTDVDSYTVYSIIHICIFAYYTVIQSVSGLSYGSWWELWSLFGPAAESGCWHPPDCWKTAALILVLGPVHTLGTVSHYPRSLSWRTTNILPGTHDCGSHPSSDAERATDHGAPEQSRAVGR